MKIGNGFARNVSIFDVDNSSSPHTDIRRNNFLVLGEESTEGIIDNIGAAEKIFSIDFCKSKTILLRFTSQW